MDMKLQFDTEELAVEIQALGLDVRTVLAEGA